MTQHAQTPHQQAQAQAPLARQAVGLSPDPRRWRALALLCAVNFMVILDAQIVILALPSISRGLGFSSGGSQWVLSAYLLAFGGLLMLGGRTGDLLGRRRVFLAGTALFLVSSLLCGLAWSAAGLVAARVAQGVSAALMAPTGLAILMTTFDEGAERNRALAAWSGLGGLGATGALLLGGTLTGSLGWRWIFLLNVPVAAGMLGIAPSVLRESRAPAAPPNYDIAGAAVITAALTALIYAVVRAPLSGWASSLTIVLLAGSAALITAFTAIEARSAAPLIPLRIFRSRALAGGNAVMLLSGMAAWGMALALSQYAQQVLGYSPLRFGLGTVVMTTMAMAGAYTAQGIVTRAGPRPVAALSMALMTGGCLLLTGISAHGTYFSDIFPGLLIFGLGLGAGTVAATIAALTGVSGHDAGVASGTNTAAFQVGGALGAAIVTTVITSRAAGPTGRAAMASAFGDGFAASALFAATGVLLALVLLGRAPQAPLTGRNISPEDARTLNRAQAASPRD